MKFPMTTLVALTLVACSPAAQVPTSPNPATAASRSPDPLAATSGIIVAMAVEHSGACIAGATFEVVSGQGPIGDIIRQQTPCEEDDAWFGGFVLEHLTMGVAVTLRATAPGYNTVEKSVLPILGGSVEFFVLNPLPRQS